MLPVTTRCCPLARRDGQKLIDLLIKSLVPLHQHTYHVTKKYSRPINEFAKHKNRFYNIFKVVKYIKKDFKIASNNPVHLNYTNLHTG